MAEIQYCTTADGAHLAYQVVGSGPIDLVSVPGFTTHLELMWEIPGYAEMVDRLSSFARVVLFDKRGTGLSDRSGRHPTLDEQAADVEAILDAIDAPRAALFGWSEGAAISTLLAASRPQRVTALALFGGTACVLQRPGYDAGMSAELLEQFGAAAVEGWGGANDMMLNLVSPSRIGDEIYRRASIRALRSAYTPAEVASFIEYVRDLDYRHVLPAVGVPTLVMHRSGDQFVPIGMGRYLAEKIPGAVFVELPGDDHPPWLGDVGRLGDEIETFLAGRTASVPIRRVLATVLFTDIVGSTRRLAKVGDERWRATLAAHDRIHRRHVEAYRGHIIKFTGDGCLARFDLPGAAIRCAQALSRELREMDVEVRAGLHTGEIELLDTDVAGIAVHLAARVAEAASPGEILVTSTVKDLTAGGGFPYSSRGDLAYRGVPGTWPTYAVAS